MKKKLFAMALLSAVSVVFADPSQGLEQEGKTLDQKSIETKKQDALERLNNDLSKIPQSVKECVFNAATIEQLENCHKQSK
jgi:hypothetical protein